MPAEQTGIVRENYLWKVFFTFFVIKYCNKFECISLTLTYQDIKTKNSGYKEIQKTEIILLIDFVIV